MSEKAIPYLRINIPETYWNDTEMFYVYNDWSNNGMLSMIRNKKNFNLFNAFDQVEKTQYGRQVKDDDPFVIYRNRDSDYENVVKVERYVKCQEGIAKDIGDGVIQRYIRCRGKNRQLERQVIEAKKRALNGPSVAEMKEKNSTKNMGAVNGVVINNGNVNSIEKLNKDLNKVPTQGNHKQSKATSTPKDQERTHSKTQPSVIRIEYKTRYNPDKSNNVAYCLSNREFVEDAIYPFTKEISEKYTQLCTLNTASESSFVIYKMSGESLAPYEFYANELVKYCQKWFKMLLKTIIVDFMKDERGIIYFLGVKGFEVLNLPSSEKMIKQLAPVEEDSYKKFYKTWTCRLCLLPYPRSRITKTVTFKLLYKLKGNLKKRGFNYFEHINNNIYSESQTCRVCDLCYALLLTEQELMEMEKTIALCNNIDVPNEETLNEKDKTPEGLVKAPQKFKTLNQWRIMFYFLKFYFMDYQKFPFEDGSQLPDNATPQEKKKGKTNYKLFITIFNQKISIPIFSEMKQFTHSDEVELNRSKIFYFFSSENSSLKQILRNEEVDFRIVLNDKFNEPLAVCKTKCLSNYEESFKEKPMTTKKILNFFSDYIKYFKCQMYIGLKNDGPVQTENRQMYCYNLPNPIYITDLNYYSHHTLPNDWYELYVPQGIQVEEDYSVNNLEIEKKIDEIILRIEGKEKKIKEQNEDEVYDPYDLLVQIENKNNIINKIESIPIVLDTNFVEMQQEKRKERPQTSKLKAKFNFSSKKDDKSVDGKKSTTNLFFIDEEVREKRRKEEEERRIRIRALEEQNKQKEAEREQIIKDGTNEHIDDLLARMDKELNIVENSV